MKLLCWIGLHWWELRYAEDGKGNSGAFVECKYCHKVEEQP